MKLTLIAMTLISSLNSFSAFAQTTSSPESKNVIVKEDRFEVCNDLTKRYTSQGLVCQSETFTLNQLDRRDVNFAIEYTKTIAALKVCQNVYLKTCLDVLLEAMTSK